MRSISDGTFALGVLTGVIITFSIGPVLNILEVNNTEIGPEHVFSAVTGGITTALAGWWIYRRTQSDERIKEQGRAAQILQHAITHNLVVARALLKVTENYDDPDAIARIGVHPLFTSYLRSLSYRFLTFPQEQIVTVIPHLPDSEAKEIISFNLVSQNINTSIQSLMTKKSDILRDCCEPPYDRVGDQIVFTDEEKRSEANARAKQLSPEVEVLRYDLNNIFGKLGKLRGALTPLLPEVPVQTVDASQSQPHSS